MSGLLIIDLLTVEKRFGKEYKEEGLRYVEAAAKVVRSTDLINEDSLSEYSDSEDSYDEYGHYGEYDRYDDLGENDELGYSDSEGDGEDGEDDGENDGAN
ncbi:hypothetical protein LTS10_003297 [Elasticomyces elasticus]|nr:hypothetical protein LTS10_003297 [Elasticomyces elasticus]